MREIAVFTGSRAEYGIMRKICHLLFRDPNVKLQLIVAGAHLSPDFGMTVQEIEADELPIAAKVETLADSTSPAGICRSMGLGLERIPVHFAALQPSILLVCGDRYEALVAAQAAMIHSIPIAHIHGGETSFGSLDERMRHAITKMADIHFTTCETYRQRVIQLGENPKRVHNVGAPALESMIYNELPDARTVATALNFDLAAPFVLVTMHPCTAKPEDNKIQLQGLFCALDALSLRAIFTFSGADHGGQEINAAIEEYVQKKKGRCLAVKSLGVARYARTAIEALAVVGNSSSGIIETPSLGTPTVNIGLRQAGRVRAASVIDCEPSAGAIIKALETALSSQWQTRAKACVNPFEGRETARRIAEILKNEPLEKFNLKLFHDIRAVE